jgi:Domain of unknown function (DUF222)
VIPDRTASAPMATRSSVPGGPSVSGGTFSVADTFLTAGAVPGGPPRSDVGPGGTPAAPVPADGEPGGLTVSWTGGLGIGQVLAAAHRHQLHRAGADLPAWGEEDGAGKGESQPAAGPEVGPQGDELGEEAVRAALEGRGRVLTAATLGGHVVMAPGPDLAGWLACGQAADRDDAALVTSITAWRKVTSWAQAQELAAVAELARRRGVAGAGDAGEADRDPATDPGPEDSDPVAALAAGFAPNEVALALMLTVGGAEYWMDLAVSLSRRLPATLVALGEGKIDLNRAKLIDQFTSSLDVDLARAVERRVLARAEHQTSGQLRASLQRAVLAADPAAAERRRREAEKRAWVALFGDHDGTASLSGRSLPAAQAAAAWARICAMAKAMEAAGAGGGADLLRAQVFVGLLLGTLPLIPPAEGAPAEEDEPDDGGAEDDGREGDGREGDGREGDGREGDGPGSGGPDDSGPGDGGSGNSGPGDSGPGNSGPGNSAPGGDPEGDWRSSAGRTAGKPGTDAPPVWPPLPLPGAAPTPGCARPPRASPDGLQDRRGPPRSPRLTGRAVLCVPWRTLAGWGSEPGELSRIGPVTAGVARDLALAAVADVTCEWRVIVVGRSGGALAVTKIRRVGAGARARGGSSAPSAVSGSGNAGATPGVVGRITLTIPVGLLDPTAMPNPTAMPTVQEWGGSGVLAGVLGAALRAGADAFSARRSRTGPGDCTHGEASPGYQVPDPMRALVEARDQTCGFPVCRQPAWRCEQDHTITYRLGGPTCPCNLSPECTRHHHLKHLPGWRLDQPRPGVLTWITPARLTHTVTAGPYPV